MRRLLVPVLVFALLAVLIAALRIDQAAPPPRQRFVAHAGGLVDGVAYSNSLDALEAGYRRGYRLFELDFSWTSDQQLALIHDWEQSWARLFAEQGVPTAERFRSARMSEGRHRQMMLDDLLAWLGQHEDAFVVTDVKEHNVEALQRIAGDAGELATRFIPQIYDPDEFDAVRALGFRHLILTVYRSKLGEPELVEWARSADLWALTVPDYRVARGEFAVLAGTAAPPIFVHTVNSAERWQWLRDNGFHGIYTDTLFESATESNDQR